MLRSFGIGVLAIGISLSAEGASNAPSQSCEVIASGTLRCTLFGDHLDTDSAPLVQLGEELASKRGIRADQFDVTSVTVFAISPLRGIFADLMLNPQNPGETAYRVARVSIPVVSQSNFDRPTDRLYSGQKMELSTTYPLARVDLSFIGKAKLRRIVIDLKAAVTQPTPPTPPPARESGVGNETQQVDPQLCAPARPPIDLRPSPQSPPNCLLSANGAGYPLTGPAPSQFNNNPQTDYYRAYRISETECRSSRCLANMPTAHALCRKRGHSDAEGFDVTQKAAQDGEILGGYQFSPFNGMFNYVQYEGFPTAQILSVIYCTPRR